MSFIQKLKDKWIAPPVAPQQSTPLFTPQDKIKHEFVNFSSAYRIGLLGFYIQPEDQEILKAYQSKLEKLGYECEILLFIDNPEMEKTIYIQKFTPEDLDRKTGLPNSPKTDRFMVKKFDLLMNLYFEECLPLQYISHMSFARCRVAPFEESFRKCADLLIPEIAFNNTNQLINQINETLNIRPYERKTF